MTRRAVLWPVRGLVLAAGVAWEVWRGRPELIPFAVPGYATLACGVLVGALLLSVAWVGRGARDGGGLRRAALASLGTALVTAGALPWAGRFSAPWDALVTVVAIGAAAAALACYVAAEVRAAPRGLPDWGRQAEEAGVAASDAPPTSGAGPRPGA